MLDANVNVHTHGAKTQETKTPGDSGGVGYLEDIHTSFGWEIAYTL